MNFFDRINNWIQNVEFSVVNLVSTVAPWLAPLAPAYLSYNHMINILDFPVWVALSLAGVVEMLGLSTISTSLMFWNHNRRYTADKNKVPLFVPIFSFLFYLAIVLTVNVMLEIDTNREVQAKALLTLMTIPAAVTLAVRSMHKEIIDGLKRPKITKPDRKVSGNFPIKESRQAYRDWRNVPHEDRMKIATMETADIVSNYGTSDRTARNWKSSAEEYAEGFVFGE